MSDEDILGNLWGFVENAATGAWDWVTNDGENTDEVLSGITALGGLLGREGAFGSDIQEFLGGSGGTPPVGYQGKIPNYRAERDTVPNTYNPYRRPGSGGQRYFTDMQFVEGDPDVPTQTSEGLAALNLANAVATNTNPLPPNSFAHGGLASIYGSRPTPMPSQAQNGLGRPTPHGHMQDTPQGPIEFTALDPGPIMDFREGGYLRGPTDGMADQVPAMIEGQKPAALGHGEMVIPADVVSGLGNGNSEAGAQQLYALMDRVRQARTGQKQQAKRINPQQMMPR